MVGLMTIAASVKWNQPGFRDPGISSPFVLGLIYAVLSVIPIGMMAGMQGFITLMADRWLKGRLNLTGNALIGATLGALNALGDLFVGQVVPGGMHLNMATAAIFVPILVVGGIVISLGMRRRSRD